MPHKYRIERNDLLGNQYSINKKIRFEISVLRLALFYYSEAYIVLTERITAAGTIDANERNKNLTFKNNTSFIPYI